MLRGVKIVIKTERSNVNKSKWWMGLNVNIKADGGNKVTSNQEMKGQRMTLQIINGLGM